MVARSIPEVIGGHSLPRSLTAAWCAQQGLTERPGSSTVVRSFAGLNVALVNVGATLNDLEHYRLAGASAVRCAGDGDVAFLLPTDGLDDPARWPRRWSRGPSSPRTGTSPGPATRPSTSCPSATRCRASRSTTP